MKRSLTKHERVRRRSDLRRLFCTAKRFECSGLKLLFTRNDLSWNRAAFSTVRGFPGAVQRNRSKRVAREAYRSIKERLIAGYDLIFIVGPGAYAVGDRTRQILLLLNQAGLLR